MIWSAHGEPPAGSVVTTCPPDLLPTGSDWPPAAAEVSGRLERDPSRLAALVPTTLRIELPGPPTAARSFKLGDGNLYLLVVWSRDIADTALDANLKGLVDNELNFLSHLTEDNRFNRGEIARLRAVVNGLEEGVVSVDVVLGQASVNEAAAKLLRLAPGKVPAGDFAAAMAGLIERSINGDEIAAANKRLHSDPTNQFDQVWRFADEPTHLRVMSTPVREEGFEGRIWVFTDESALWQSLDDSEYARAVLRASSDAMLDPLVQVTAVRDGQGRVIDFTYRDVNQATCDYLGVTREELVGKTLLETLPNIDKSGLLGHYIRCAETGEPLVIDDFFYYNEMLGAARRYDVRAARISSDSLSLTWRDSTERFETAQLVAESEEQFRLLAENSGDMVARIRDGRFVWISPAVQTVLGGPTEEFLGREILDLVPPEDREVHLDWRRAIASGQSILTRMQIIGHGGVRHWVHLNAKPFIDAHGNPDGSVASLRLIDSEVAAEQKAEQARELQAAADARYRRLMDGSPIGMCLLRADGRFDQVNEALCDFFGYDADTLRTKTWQDITAPEFIEVDMRNVEDILAGRIEAYRLTQQYIHADGHRIWGDLSVSCLRDTDGRLEFFVAQIIDVTAQVDAQRRLADSDDRNRAMAQRLQTLTDRLTSELDSAAGYIGTLLPGDLPGAVHVTSLHLPSTELAGDCYDYSWIDEDHLVVYLLDVSGHGVAPALVSISVHNMLRSGSLSRETMLVPGAALAALNQRFPMDRQGGHYFTIWYGVYEKSTRTLRYASAGQPPALLYPVPGRSPIRLAASTGMPVGMFDGGDFSTESVTVPPDSRMLLYSDGVYEWKRPDGGDSPLDDFIELCTEHAADSDFSLEVLLADVKARTPDGVFDDDCSLVSLQFD